MDSAVQPILCCHRRHSLLYPNDVDMSSRCRCTVPADCMIVLSDLILGYLTWEMAWGKKHAVAVYADQLFDQGRLPRTIPLVKWGSAVMLTVYRIQTIQLTSKTTQDPPNVPTIEENWRRCLLVLIIQIQGIEPRISYSTEGSCSIIFWLAFHEWQQMLSWEQGWQCDFGFSSCRSVA